MAFHQQQEFGNAAQQQTGATFAPRQGASGVAQMFGGLFPSKGPSTQVLHDALATYEIVAKESDFANAGGEGVEVKVYGLDANQTNGELQCSALVLVAKDDGFCIYHTMLLGASCAKPGVITEQIPGMQQPITIPAAVSDYLDPNMRNAVMSLLGEHYSGVEAIDAYASVIPATIDVKKKEEVGPLFINAVHAVLSELFEHNGVVASKGITAQVVLKGAPLAATISHGNPNTVGLDKYVRRTDFIVSLDNQQAANPRQGQRQQSANVYTMGGFVDLCNIGNGTRRDGWSTPVQEPQTSHLYRPILVITSLNATEVELPEVVVTGLATITSMCGTEDQNSIPQWVNQWAPNLRKSARGDIGALGWCVPEIQAHLGDMSEAEYMSFLTSVIAKDPIIAIDVSEADPYSWKHGMFARMASADPRVSTTARDEFTAVMDRLTSGGFSKTVVAMGGISQFVTDIGRFPSAVCTIDGVTMDARTLDHLAIANIVDGTDPTPLEMYSKAMYGLNIPQIQRINTLIRLYDTYIPSYEIYGYHHRMVIEPKLLAAMVSSLAGSGVAIHPARSVESVSDTRTVFTGGAYTGGSLMNNRQPMGQQMSGQQYGFSGFSNRTFNL